MRNTLGCFIFLIIMMTSQIFAGSVYYVDATDGNDLNDGLSPTTAWQTVAKVNSSSFSPGDNIYFKCGGHWRESLNIPSEGSSESQITFGSYGSGNKPILNGSDLLSDWTQDGGADRWYATLTVAPDVIFKDGDRFNRVDRYSGESSAADVDAAGEWYYDSVADRLYIYSTADPDTEYTDPGIEAAVRERVIWAGAGTWEYITIENLEVKNGASFGIRVGGNQHHWIIDNCTVHHCGVCEGPTDDNIEIEEADYCTVKNCTLYEGGAHNLMTWRSHYAVIEYNEMYNCSHNNVDVHNSGTGVIVRYNYLHFTSDYHTVSAGIYAEGTIEDLYIYYNLLVDACIQLEDHSDYVYVYNNTYYTPSTNINRIAYKIYTDGHVTVKNNIGYIPNAGQGVLRVTNSTNKTVDYNCWDVDSYAPTKVDGVSYLESEWSDYQSDTGFDAHGINASPLFVDPSNSELYLQIGSPCIDAGTDVGLTKDYVGNTVPYGWGVDIGAYEYTGVSPLNAEINASPTSGEVPLTVNFTGNASGGTPPYTYTWDFGDGYSSTEQNPTHTFNNSGDYTVTLTATDSESNQDSDFLIINAYAYVTPLEASSNASPTSGEVPLTVNFTGTATGGVLPYSYSWDFGDSTSSSEQNPSHTYNDPGNFTVTLIVTDSFSNQDSDSLTINASEIAIPLEASCAATPASGEVPLTVYFTGSAAGGVLPYSYSWDFGDGTSSSEQNPTHTFPQAGDYTVALTVTDSLSNQDSDFLIINAIAPAIPLEASCDATPASGEIPLLVNFTGNASGGAPPYTYTWDLGDGYSSTEQNPTHTYSDAGNYTVTLAVTDSKSSQDNDSTVISARAPTPPYISCSPKNFYFGASASGYETTDQYLRIINAGNGKLTWNIEDDADWLSCSPSSGLGRRKIAVSVNASGLALGLYTATITVSSPEAYNSPQYVSVNLRVYESGQDSSPFGYFDTPLDGSVVAGCVPVAGWALDDIEVTRVEIKRNSDPEDLPEAIGPDGLVYIGDAIFVEGARPDIENSYPDYPLNSRAGWGYTLLTNELPYRGNGSFTIYAFGYDASGHRVEIGRKTVLCDNANSVKPFGTIDTPEQGETIDGNDYINFGWALTPLPKTIPKDGSTIWVWVDGVQIGHPVYNQYWEDIATSYPEYNNAQGAMGYYHLDTTQYDNGVHTISWSVMDDEGEVEGIGSRYFSIDNIEGENASQGCIGLNSTYQEDPEGSLSVSIKEVRMGYMLQVNNDRLQIYSDRLQIESEMNINEKRIARPQPDDTEKEEEYTLRDNIDREINTRSILNIQIEEMEPVRIVLGESSNGEIKYIGWGENKSKDLLIGSTLDREKGIFSWIPTPGFIGRYVLHFAITDISYMSKPVQVVVNIIPKSYN